MGKYNEALELYYHVCEVRTDILGINHPETLNTKYNMAITFLCMKKYNEALDVFDQVYKIQESL